MECFNKKKKETQDTLERVSVGLGTPQDPSPEELDEVAGDREVKAAAPREVKAVDPRPDTG